MGVKKKISRLAALLLLSIVPRVYAVPDNSTEMYIKDDLTLYGVEGTSLDPDMEVKGFSVFGATQAAYAGAVPGPGNVVVNGYLAVSSGAYFAAGSTFTSVYATGYSSAAYYYGNGSTLTGVSTHTFKIGDSYGGGKVFWVDAAGRQVLIAATADQSAGIKWSNNSNTTGASQDGIYAGKANTVAISTMQHAGSYAAQLCSDYSVTADSEYFDDWYLPSKAELVLLFDRRNVVGGFTTGNYWSSSEYAPSPADAWKFDFNSGSSFFIGKVNSNYVRCIRAGPSAAIGDLPTNAETVTDGAYLSSTQTFTGVNSFYALKVSTGFGPILTVSSAGVAVGSLDRSTGSFFSVNAAAPNLSGQQEIAIGMSGYVHGRGTDFEDVLVGGNFEAELLNGNANFVAGLRATAQVNTGGIATNVVGLYVDEFRIPGQATNRYGIYISTLTTAVQPNPSYAVYSQDSKARSYFAGPVGIGTAEPKGMLMVVSTATGGGDYPVGIIQAGAGSPSGIIGAKLRGTMEAPLPLVNGDVMFAIRTLGYHAIGDYKDGATIASVVDGIPSGASLPARLEFQTSEAASGDPQTRLVIKADGAVGISTGTPQAALDVMSTGTGSGYIQIWRDGNGTIVSSISAAGIITASTFNALGSAYLMNGKVVIDSDRNVYARQLAVEQEVNFTTFTISANQFSVGGSTFAVKSGNVGIGTGTPNIKLEVAGSGAVNLLTAEELLRLERPYGGGSTYPQAAALAIGKYTLADQDFPYTRLDINLKANADLELTTDMTAMSLQSNGFVGIGVQAPQGLLHLGTNGVIISTGGAIQTTGMGHGATAGGTRGVGATDLQTSRTGVSQVASGYYAVIGGGSDNTAASVRAVVAGGALNRVETLPAGVGYGAIAGGLSNRAANDFASVAGGFGNHAVGQYAFIAGGRMNSAKGDFSFAAGRKSSSTAAGTFTWADSSEDLPVLNNVQDRTVFKSRGGFLVTGSTDTVVGGTVDRGVFMTGSGLVGISTGSPQAALDVVSTGTALNDSAQIWRDSNGVVVASMTATGRLYSATPGDGLGSHIATTTLQLGGYGVNTSSSVSGDNFQIKGNTVLAVLAGAGSFGAGIDAGKNTTGGGTANTFLGSYSGGLNTSGTNNVFVGHNTAYNNLGGGNNTVVGKDAAFYNVSGGANAIYGVEAGGKFSGSGSFSNSVILGYQAGSYLTNSGNNNTLVGYRAGDTLSNGSGNIIIGYDQDAPNSATSNFLNIGGAIYGDLSTGKIGIGTNLPGSLLEVYSSAAAAGPFLRLTNTGSSNYAAGIDLRGNPPGGGTGYSAGRIYGTIDASGYQYARTTFATPTSEGNFADTLSLKNGQVGIGQNVPTAALHLKAGTASANTAPLKLTAGTNLSITEAGAIEYDGTHLYFSLSEGGPREQLDRPVHIIQTVTTLPLSTLSGTMAAVINASLTVRKVGLFNVPARIAVNQLTFSVGAVTTSGNYKVCVYNEAGDAKLIDVTAPATGGGANNATVSLTVLEPGNYYVAMGCQSTCDNTVYQWPTLSVPGFSAATSPAGKKVLEGTVTHASGTCDSSLGAITPAASSTPVIRFDN